MVQQREPQWAEVSDEENGVTVTFVIHEGTRVRVREVREDTVVLDANHRVIDVNRRWRELTGQQTPPGAEAAEVPRRPLPRRIELVLIDDDPVENGARGELCGGGILLLRRRAPAGKPMQRVALWNDQALRQSIEGAAARGVADSWRTFE